MTVNVEVHWDMFVKVDVKIAILRQYAGHGVGRDILHWAMDYIKSKGKIARLDCMAENPRINEYYKNLHFNYVGLKVLSTGFKVSLYEKS